MNIEVNTWLYLCYKFVFALKLPGLYLFIFGILGLIATALEQQFVIFNWMDRWGDTNGILLKLGISAAGLIFFFGSKRKKRDSFRELEEIIQIQKQKQHHDEENNEHTAE